MLFSHGWARILTVMSPKGASAVVDMVESGDGIRMMYRVGGLPQFHEIHAGSLERLIALYGIRLVDKPEWDALKREFGETIYS
jgi:hypothetical protein